MVNDAVEALEHFIDCLRERGVRSFKGDLLTPDGTKLWNLELTFERETTKPTTRDPMTG